MNYFLLKQWVNENSKKQFLIKEVKRYNDQIALFFKNSKLFLQINFYPSNSFCFFSSKKILPFNEKISNFTDILKNHYLVKAEILPNDRIIKFTLKQTDIFNLEKTLFFHLEFIPFFPNLIITDDKNIIKEALKKITPAQNQKRIILPGMKYELPKFDITNQKPKFPMKIDNDLIIDKFPTKINDFFEDYYYNVIYKSFVGKKIEQQVRKLKKEIKKKQKKLEKLEAELKDYEKEKEWKTYLELLKGEYSNIRKGMQKIEVTNYFDENLSKIEIPLNPQFNASQNINFYAKKYKKAVLGKDKIKKQIEKTILEIDKLKEEIENVKFTDENPIQKKHEKHISLPFKKIRVNEDWEIIYGRTKSENDFITTKVAKPYDWWFHTRIFHGTHLVLRNLKKQQPPHDLILICASLAAYHSKAKKSTNIPVDYTQVKFVRKPKGAQPGFVTYSRQKTVYVNPIDERTAVKLLEKYEESSK